MAKTQQQKAALAYVRRIAEDEYVQRQLQQAIAALRDVRARVSREGPAASEDRKLYERVREASTAIRRAIGAIEEPPPPPPKRRAPKALALIVGGAACAYAVKRRSGAGDRAIATAPAPGPTNAQAPEPAAAGS